LGLKEQLVKTSVIAAMLAATLCATALFAQSERGTISGTVLDASGAVVPAARVTLTNTQTGVTFTLPSNASGEFTVPQLPVGTYTVRFEKGGFRPGTVSGIVLDASMTVRVDGKLDVGVANQAVEVSASALSVAREDAKISVTVNNKLVDELPLVVGGAMRSPSTWRISRPKRRTWAASGASFWAADNAQYLILQIRQMPSVQVENLITGPACATVVGLLTTLKSI
jgi:hypothetical protein